MIYDLLVVGIVIFFVLFGLWKGLAFQLAGILSLILGFVVAIPCSAPIAPFFGSTLPLNRFVAAGVLYALVSLGLFLAAFYYREFISKWKLENWDRHLGGMFGALKGFLFAFALTFFAITCFPSLRHPILSRPTGKLMAYTMHAFHPLWPAGFHEIIHSYIEHDKEPEEPALPKPPPVPGKK